MKKNPFYTRILRLHVYKCPTWTSNLLCNYFFKTYYYRYKSKSGRVSEIAGPMIII